RSRGGVGTPIRPAADGLRFLHVPLPAVSSTTPCGASTRSGRRRAYHVPCSYRWMVQVPPLRRGRFGLRGEMGEFPYRPRACWLKPVSIFGLLDLTTFNSGSPVLTRPSLLAPDHVDARSRHRPSRLDDHPESEGTLSRELRTAGLLQPHVP